MQTNTKNALYKKMKNVKYLKHDEFLSNLNNFLKQYLIR